MADRKIQLKRIQMEIIELKKHKNDRYSAGPVLVYKFEFNIYFKFGFLHTYFQ